MSVTSLPSRHSGLVMGKGAILKVAGMPSSPKTGKLGRRLCCCQKHLPRHPLSYIARTRGEGLKLAESETVGWRNRCTLERRLPR